MPGSTQPARKRELVIEASTCTLTPQYAGKTVTNFGAGGAVIYTLGTGFRTGDEILILAAADNDLTVAPATSDTLIGKGDIDLDSVALSTSGEKLGGALWFTYLGTAWHVAYLTEEAQTVTAVD